MQHCDPDVLGLVALGEPASAADAAHLSSCVQCQTEAASLARVVSAARIEVPDGPPIAPPDRVWERIAAQTGLPSSVGQVSVGQMRPRQSARTRWWHRPTLAVAASALVVGAVAGSLGTRLLARDDIPRAGTVVAQVQLAALPLAPSAAGRARVVQATDGEQLVVDVSSLRLLDGQFYEVWLIDRAVKRMVPVGILRGSQGQFDLPTGLDLRQYPVVDISVQVPGNPAHSGKSVLRGSLPA